MSVSHPDRWIPVRRKVPDARVRLFCFPYAGGGANAFRSWLIPGVEVCGVQPPGRETRLAEPPFTRMEPLVYEAAQVIAKYDDLPRAFYGHSMGALIAYELMARLGGVHLFLSGCASPRTSVPLNPVHALPADELLGVIGRWNGTPEEVLRDPELMAFLMPLLRADLELYEHYCVPGRTRLTQPVTAFAGEHDEYAPVARMEQWRAVTSGPFRLQILPGGHFFLRDSKEALLQVIQQELKVEQTA